MTCLLQRQRRIVPGGQQRPVVDLVRLGELAAACHQLGFGTLMYAK
ncbi:hypothetical protein [Streptomyces sp. P17]|nr:hypothetical protein [Streptomyces sp. P17]MDT9698919.1 hypothetical protein [Streptomyces sp. P17]